MLIKGEINNSWNRNIYGLAYNMLIFWTICIKWKTLNIFTTSWINILASILIAFVILYHIDHIWNVIIKHIHLTYIDINSLSAHTKLYVFSLARPAAPPAGLFPPCPPPCLPPSDDWTSRFKDEDLVRTDPPYVNT